MAGHEPDIPMDNDPYRRTPSGYALPSDRANGDETASSPSPAPQLYFPLDLWWHVSKFLPPDDLPRLSRVNRTLRSFLLFDRAVNEGERMRQASPDVIYSLLCRAIYDARPLPVIERIARAYHSVWPGLLDGTWNIYSGGPPLVDAARMDRVDVVELLLSLGAKIDYRWSGGWDSCVPWPHLACEPGRVKCKNALCVARLHGSEKVAQLLLDSGIEDLALDQPGEVPHREYCCYDIGIAHWRH